MTDTEWARDAVRFWLVKLLTACGLEREARERYGR
jgi:hypothetical protein